MGICGFGLSKGCRAYGLGAFGGWGVRAKMGIWMWIASFWDGHLGIWNGGT